MLVIPNPSAPPLSVISPEGASALLWKDSNLAKIAAETMKITAKDLQELNVADDVVEEPLGGAHHMMCTTKWFFNNIISNI